MSDQHNVLRFLMALPIVLMSGFGVITFDMHLCVYILFSDLHLLLIIDYLLLKYSYCFPPAQPSPQVKLGLAYRLRLAVRGRPRGGASASRRPLWRSSQATAFLGSPSPSAHCFSGAQKQKGILTA